MPSTISMIIAIFAAGSAIASPVEIVARQGGGQPKTIPVVVGSLTNAKQTTFTPNTVQANAGDTVQFQFASANHTVTQASGADAPCAPMQGGANSGFMPVQANAKTFMAFNMKVTDASTPMYMYCAAANHCQLGMTMTINAAAGDAKAYNKAATKQQTNTPADNVAGGSITQVTKKQVQAAGGGAAGGKAAAAGGAGGGAGGLLAALGGGNKGN
ncbi:uncharacterized protein L3040_005009 [Drepanopeziza brunnea f. sp. 'multigermtubi']|uniref:Extracellular serine-rich protein n=1 Tax=Marssonina brunnea f. sp. multigermtubi (strain MB_m1) TaxID=1072389 RepID=K1X2B6_MARBU|nr:extracellular serine-rich protein [Drepanopeziza brunnea f. sp. 'multigermtubi' MB_m1]EKD14933.1 extracellular serine-rich protein [Drepanopeziza brunnea f. sp. 'multigermtubi' MB_m1]KAJ5042461.1 hypothetical protein L3040_005009 [Drepanopeziza brunnea f. sp. 'multigermtubi']